MEPIVALVIALVVGCGGDEPPDDDLPRDLTRLVDCRLDRDSGGSSISPRIVAVEKMPPHVPAAFLSAEDRRFYERTRSVAIEQRSGVAEGGSSIIQQVVHLMPAITQRCIGRTADLAQGSADKTRRKAMQAMQAARLERELTKGQILSIYLNHVYLGHGAYGVASAAKTYFGKGLELLTIAEAALLAGLVASPTKYSPYRDLPRARERQRYVLNKMREDGHITEAQYQAALTEPISLAGETTP
jgi:penicillin-binding protein 1A